MMESEIAERLVQKASQIDYYYGRATVEGDLMREAAFEIGMSRAAIGLMKETGAAVAEDGHHRCMQICVAEIRRWHGEKWDNEQKTWGPFGDVAKCIDEFCRDVQISPQGMAD